MDSVTSEMINPQLNNNSLEYFRLWTWYKHKILWMNSLTHQKYNCDILVATMVSILEQKQYIWKQRKLFCVKMLFFLEKKFIEINTTWITWSIV